ncbi:MAG TPA: ABC transporter permease, partial [Vicinamibacteria bacterium]|nr:ABC transporter permease [Vicinamibacteria bacterium]
MSVLTDLRFALRLWRRHPTMVAVAGISLGLGVGATTTMYSVVNKVAHYKLGFKDVDRLVIVSNTDPDQGNNDQPPTFEIVQALRKDGTSFEDFGGAQFFGAPVTLSGTDETSRVLQMPVDVGGLSVVGVPPLLGRTYRTEDFDDVVKQKEARSIVISYETWQRRLGG